MGPALERWGIELRQGFDPAHLDPAPDRVVVGNVCRRDNPEAARRHRRRLEVHQHGRRPRRAGCCGATRPWSSPAPTAKPPPAACAPGCCTTPTNSPAFLIGGLPKNFEHSYRLPAGAAGVKHLPLAHRGGSARRTPFVVEGDEYDTAFFEKTPKFWH